MNCSHIPALLVALAIAGCVGRQRADPRSVPVAAAIDACVQNDVRRFAQQLSPTVFKNLENGSTTVATYFAGFRKHLAQELGSVSSRNVDFTVSSRRPSAWFPADTYDVTCVTATGKCTLIVEKVAGQWKITMPRTLPIPKEGQEHGSDQSVLSDPVEEGVTPTNKGKRAGDD